MSASSIRGRPHAKDPQLSFDTPTAIHAAKAIGPSGQCGASATSYVSAIDAIRANSYIPPQLDTLSVLSAG